MVIKTNPLFRATSPLSDDAASPATLVGSAEARGGAGGGASHSHETFYGQRRKIRKTKEHEMITAVMDLASHSE